MEVVYGLGKIKRYKKPVVALGVFDGVHRAHRRILKYTVDTSRRIHGTSIAVTFYPHPQKKPSLYSLPHRLRLLAELGVAACIVIRFNPKFAAISAVDFIKDILFKKIGANYICVGGNFRFGKYAQGDTGLLAGLSSTYNYKLKVFDVIKIKGRPVSSTYIRKLITRGSLNNAKELLGRRVSVFGTVIKGVSLANKLGFPTANLNPHHEVLPQPGVYAVSVTFEKNKFNGACYIGSQQQIEVHIFNFHKNIYGKDLEIQFVKKIRPKIKFKNRKIQIEQIKKDVSCVRRFFSSPQTYPNRCP